MYIYTHTHIHRDPAGQVVAVLVFRHSGEATKEMQIFERLGRHPHLAQLLAFSRRPPTEELCMVMEFAQRGSLDRVLQQNEMDGGEPVSNGVLLTVALQVMSVCIP